MEFGVGVAGGTEYMVLRCKLGYETRHVLLVSNCSNVSNTVERAAAIEEVAIEPQRLRCL